MAPLPTISLFTLLHLPLVALYFSLVSAEPQTHLVYVGVNGSFFSPSTVAAQANDVISFIFGADVHAVRQSTFEKPCTPLDGGFSSGLAGIKGVGFTGATGQPIPVWNLTVSNASRPLYFMCDSIDPVFHCSAGMVGIINSPNGTHFSAFAAAARQTNFTPSATPSVILGGNQGAFATASPSAPALAQSQPTTSPTAVAATESSESKAHDNAGAIAGGVIGGLILLVLLVWYTVKRSRKKQVLMLDRFTFKKPGDTDEGFEQMQSLPRHNTLQRSATRETMLSEIDLEKTPADRFRRKHSISESIHSVHSVHSTHTTHSVQSTRRNSLHRSGSRSSMRSQRRVSRADMPEPPLPSPPPAALIVPTVTTALPPSPTYPPPSPGSYSPSSPGIYPPPSPGIPPLSPGPGASDFQVTTATRAVSVYAPTVEPFTATAPTMPPSPGARRRPNIPTPIISPNRLARQSQIPAPPITPSPAYSFDDPNPLFSLPTPPPVPALPADTASYLKRSESSSSSMSRSRSRRVRERQEREDAEKFQRKLMLMGGDGGAVTRRAEDTDKKDDLPDYNNPDAPPNA